MNIQIINMMPLEYPYQVTRMKKQTSGLQLNYTVQDVYRYEQSDAYILIVKKPDETVRQWIEKMNIKKSKVILTVSEHCSDYHCWCIPKAFEKEFDVEKLMSYLSSILKDHPNAQLFQSLDLRMGKVHKDPSLQVCVDHFARAKSEIHLFIKDKTKRILQIECARPDVKVVQHWQKGLIEPEIDVLVIKRKS